MMSESIWENQPHFFMENLYGEFHCQFCDVEMTDDNKDDICEVGITNGDSE